MELLISYAGLKVYKDMAAKLLSDIFLGAFV